MKKIIKEIEEFFAVFFVIFLASSPLFLFKGIIFLYENGVNYTLSIILSLLIWAIWFITSVFVMVKPWKRKKNKRKEVA